MEFQQTIELVLDWLNRLMYIVQYEVCRRSSQDGTQLDYHIFVLVCAVL